MISRPCRSQRYSAASRMAVDTASLVSRDTKALFGPGPARRHTGTYRSHTSFSTSRFERYQTGSDSSITVNYLLPATSGSSKLFRASRTQCMQPLLYVSACRQSDLAVITRLQNELQTTECLHRFAARRHVCAGGPACLRVWALPAPYLTNPRSPPPEG